MALKYMHEHWNEIEAAFEKAAQEYFDHMLSDMATVEDMNFLKIIPPELITPDWKLIEFMDEEKKRIKDLRNATKRDW